MPHLECCVPVVPTGTSAIHPKLLANGYQGVQQQQHNNNNNNNPANGGKKRKAGCGQQQQQQTAKGMCQQHTGAASKEEEQQDGLSQFQLDKLAELRAQLGESLIRDTPLFDDTFSLLRWLHGWNYRIEDIVPRFAKASAIFRCMGVNGLCMEDWDELNDYARGVTRAAEYFPGGVLGLDREGNAMVLQRMGQSHPKQLAKCGRVSDVYRLSIVETVLAYQLIRREERKRRRKLGLRVIIDLEGFNSDHLCTMGLKVYGSLLKTMQDIFPDMLRQVYVVNAHYLVRTAYNIIKPVLSEQSREKVVFLDGQFKERLARDIGPENLLVHLGGSRAPQRGHPKWGTVRVGGIPPPEIRYSREAYPDEFIPPLAGAGVAEEELKRLTVPARQRRQLEVIVPDEGGQQQHRLHWYWTSSSDIDFGVLDQRGQEVWPVFRLLTDSVPEFGSVRVQGGRTYTLLFDNSFSVFTKKEIRYAIRIVRIEAEQQEEEGKKMVTDNGQMEKNSNKMEEEEGKEKAVAEQQVHLPNGKLPLAAELATNPTAAGQVMMEINC